MEDNTQFDNLLHQLSIDANKINNIDQRRESFSTDRLVDLSDLNLTSLPEDLFVGYEGVLHVNLSNNILQYLPENLFIPLTELLSLDLSYCLSPSDLDIDEVITIPENLFVNQLRLILLDLSGNQIEFLAEATFDKLYNVEAMNLSYNLLALLPTSIGNCINLEELYLVGNFLPIEFNETYTDYIEVQDFISPFSQAWQVMNNPVDMINELGIISLNPEDDFEE